MHLLFLTARLPYPPNRGDRLRAYHFIRELSRRHRISLVSFIADESETGLVAGLRPYCEEIHLVHMGQRRSMVEAATGLWRRDSLQALYFHSADMQRAVDKLIGERQFDAVYVHLFRMAQYVRQHPALYRILDLTDVISTEIGRSLPYRGSLWQAVYRVELPRIRRAELEAAQLANETWVISEAEKTALASLGEVSNVQVIPNGVDQLRFHPTGQHKSPQTLIMVGHMGVLHNVDAAEYLARDILPLIREQIPAVRLQIVGAEPIDRVRRLADLPGVAVLGQVADLNDQLNRATVFVAPLRFAAGVQNKVLEAMATALPVVTTTCVNEGLDAVSGEHLQLADGAEQTASAVIELLQNRSMRQKLGNAARDFVTHKYRWDIVDQRVQQIEQSLLAG